MKGEPLYRFEESPVGSNTFGNMNSNWVGEKRDIIFLTWDRVWQRPLSLSLPLFRVYFLSLSFSHFFSLSSRRPLSRDGLLHLIYYRPQRQQVISVNTDSCEHVHTSMSLETRISERKTDEGRDASPILISSFINSFAIKDSCNRPTYCTLLALKAPMDNWNSF